MLSSHEQLDNLGLKHVQLAVLHQCHSILGSQDDLVGVVKELLPDSRLDSVPPCAQLGSPLKHIQASTHRLLVGQRTR